MVRSLATTLNTLSDPASIQAASFERHGHQKFRHRVHRRVGGADAAARRLGPAVRIFRHLWGRRSRLFSVFVSRSEFCFDAVFGAQPISLAHSFGVNINHEVKLSLFLSCPGRQGSDHWGLKQNKKHFCYCIVTCRSSLDKTILVAIPIPHMQQIRKHFRYKFWRKFRIMPITISGASRPSFARRRFAARQSEYALTCWIITYG